MKAKSAVVLDGDNNSGRGSAGGGGVVEMGNGTKSQSTNGLSMDAEAVLVGENSNRKPHNVRQEEMVRLMLQSLQDLGFKKTADLLQKESGYVLEPPAVSQFRNGVLSGNWDLVEELLPVMNIDKDQLPKVQFLLRQQKYLELLEQQKVKKGLVVLRQELTPLNMNPSKLHELSTLMMCADTEELKRRAQWDGANGNSRSDLLIELQKHISSSMMMPEHRLETLLEQAIQLQKMSCLYHNTEEEDVSLYTDHVCDRSQFPSVTTHILEEHADEVWFVAFSHDGEYLASASKDTTAIIWSVKNFRPVHILMGHKDAISHVAWSPDDSMLLTGSNDRKLRLWNAKTATFEREYGEHTEVITSCAWLPDGKRFVSGSQDKQICLWSIDGTVLHKWTGTRVHDLAVTPDGRLMAVIAEKKIRLINVEDKSDIAYESDPITSVFVAQDCRHALVNLSIGEIHLWDLEEKRVVRKYVGQKQKRFVIRSCFGGIRNRQNFVISGSEASSADQLSG
ncbi:hypothetical protein HK102_009531 [Quaeritorhiza haematococci]|nr:hypothetical protein HK102_009531 [Quaeritorhiza haematococci]